MKRIILLCIAFAFISSASVQAQSSGSTYTTALGLKMWNYGAGFTIKHFVTPNQALEGVLYGWHGGGRFTGLYEFHYDIPGAEGLRWYIGPGMHVGTYDGSNYNSHYYHDEWESGTYVGIDGVLGLDYKFNGVPINLSIDWQPSFEFGDNRGFIGAWGGLAVRYTFN